MGLHVLSNPYWGYNRDTCASRRTACTTSAYSRLMSRPCAKKWAAQKSRDSLPLSRTYQVGKTCMAVVSACVMHSNRVGSRYDVQHRRACLCCCSPQAQGILLLWGQRPAFHPGSCIISCHACHGIVQLGTSQLSGCVRIKSTCNKLAIACLLHTAEK